MGAHTMHAGLSWSWGIGQKQKEMELELGLITTLIETGVLLFIVKLRCHLLPSLFGYACGLFGGAPPCAFWLTSEHAVR